MPLSRHPDDNPYRLNYFAILGVGVAASPATISQMADNIITRIRLGEKHIIAGREISEADVNEARTRLLNDETRAAEVPFVHAGPSGSTRRLQELCREIIATATPPPAPRLLNLSNLRALAPLVPDSVPEDIAWPEWEEFGIPGPDAHEDREYDVQFDV
jgi:hypothetical protein